MLPLLPRALRRNSFALFVFFMLILTAIASRVHAAGELSLEDYLGQVQKQHGGFQGAINIRDGAALRSQDAEILTSPTLFSNLSYIYDDKNDPLFSTDQQKRANAALGVSQITKFGMKAQASFNVDYTSFSFLPAAARPNSSYYQGRPTLEVTQSLWRNGFGSETRAILDASEAAARATSFAQSYQSRLILSQAEQSYWTLSLARGAVRVAKEVLDRAQRLYDWSSNRARLRLADDSDRLQAEALLKLRKLDYQLALDNERTAARSFNQLRGEDSDAVAQPILSLGAELAEAKLNAPARASMREDVLSAQQQQNAAVASAQIGKEKAKPTLDAYATLSLNGTDPTFTPTLSNSFKTDQPSATVGIRFSVPLDFGLVSDVNRGYSLEQEGANRVYQRRFFEQENDWAELNRKLGEAKQRYELSRSLELAQKEKLRVERDRLNKGRSTTFTVIQFEQDAAQSELNTLRSQTDILNIIAQMKTFGGPL